LRQGFRGGGGGDVPTLRGGGGSRTYFSGSEE